MKKQSISAEDFDKKFDNGEDVTEFLDIEKAKRPGQTQKRKNSDFLKCTKR